jgi:hypothetical protein
VLKLKYISLSDSIFFWGVSSSACASSKARINVQLFPRISDKIEENGYDKQMSQPESDNKLEQLTDLQTQMLHQMTLQQKQQQIQQGPYPEIMGSLLICISKMAVSSSQKFLQRFPKEIFCSHIHLIFESLTDTLNFRTIGYFLTNLINDPSSLKLQSRDQNLI